MIYLQFKIKLIIIIITINFIINIIIVEFEVFVLHHLQE